MKFQVGKFTCDLSRDDCGRLQTKWRPALPKYLNRAEREQYRTGCVAFDLAEGLGKLAEPLPQFDHAADRSDAP